MTKMFLSLLMILFSFIMYFLNHPISMGLMILLQTFLICLISGMIIKTYWFSYILFLTFLGGLLVLFIYVSSIASNEMFIFPFKLKIMLFFMMMFILILSLIFSLNLKLLNFSFNSDMSSIFNYFMFFNNENTTNMSKLYNNQTFLLMMMLIIYLFITLIAVIKITNIFFGPLRSFNYN